MMCVIIIITVFLTDSVLLPAHQFKFLNRMLNLSLIIYDQRLINLKSKQKAKRIISYFNCLIKKTLDNSDKIIVWHEWQKIKGSDK